MENEKNISAKKKIGYSVIGTLVVLFFVVPLCFAKNISSIEVFQRNWFVPVFYGIMAISSLVVLIGYCIFFRKKYFWILLSIISACICNVGYFSLSLSTTATEAILANKIAYFGNVFLPFFLLITIADACRLRYNKFFVYILFSISCIMFIFCATGGYFDLFYKSISFEMIDGVVHLHKTYGIMHTFYMLYVFAYFGLMIAIIFYSHRKGKLISQKHILSLLLSVFINIFLWVIERFVHIPFEILSLSYVLTSITIIYLYKQLNSFGLLDYYNISLDLPSDSEGMKVDGEPEDTVQEEVIEDNFANFSDDKLKGLFQDLNLPTKLSEREIEIAILMIKNIKRKKIAEFLFVTEHTVKFHISNIYKKTNVSSRNELVDLLKKNI